MTTRRRLFAAVAAASQSVSGGHLSEAPAWRSGGPAAAACGNTRRSDGTSVSVHLRVTRRT